MNFENVLIITLGDTKSELDDEQGSIIFDIDRIVEKKILLEQGAFKRQLDQLHRDVWNVFSSAKGEKLDSLLKRGGSYE